MSFFDFLLTKYKFYVKITCEINFDKVLGSFWYHFTCENCLIWENLKMKFKNIMCLILSIWCIGLGFFSVEASALFGNTHYCIGKKMIDKFDKKFSECKGYKPLSDGEKDAFLSGMVYADIGRAEFDKKAGVDSDSDVFAEEMEKTAETSEEKWFARGFKMHVVQDRETKKFLKEVLDHGYSSYSEYAVDCATVDSYFLKKYGILCNEFLDKFNFDQVASGCDMKDLAEKFGVPEDKIKSSVKHILRRCYDYPKKHNLVLYDNLIQKTYQSLGFEASVDEIHQQSANILGIFLIMPHVVEKRAVISEDLVLKIEEKSDLLADWCLSELEF